MSTIYNNPYPTIPMRLQQMNCSTPPAPTTVEQIARIPEENKIEAQRLMEQRAEAITHGSIYFFGTVASAGAYIAGAFRFAGTAGVNDSLYLGGLVGLVLSSIGLVACSLAAGKMEDEAKEVLLYGKDAKYVRLLKND